MGRERDCGETDAEEGGGGGEERDPVGGGGAEDDCRERDAVMGMRGGDGGENG